MGTVVRPEISAKNKYWIDKHRYYELKHFCLQYPYWKRTYAAINELGASYPSLERVDNSNISDTTAKCAIRKAYYSDRIKMIEDAAMEADQDLYIYILKAVTENLAYTYLTSQMEIPCSRDTYYDRYRRFFWLLSESRN